MPPAQPLSAPGPGCSSRTRALAPAHCCAGGAAVVDALSVLGDCPPCPLCRCRLRLQAG